MTGVNVDPSNASVVSLSKNFTLIVQDSLVPISDTRKTLINESLLSHSRKLTKTVKS